MARVAKAAARALAAAAGGLVVMIAAACAAAAQDMRDMSILTGAEGGTYHRFGLDIATVVKKVCRADLEVRTSQGSLENLGRLRDEPFAQLAIVQQDVLDYVVLNKGRNPTVKDWVDSFKYVLPLYREEVHIIARRDAGLASLADLAGKRVAVGEPGSGTNLTATLVLINAGLRDQLKAEVEIGAREGVLRLLGLESGASVDAVFYVAGQPVPLLSGGDARITPGQLEQLSLLAIPKNPLPKLYAPARLTPAAYPWLQREIETLSVRAVLITYDFKGPQCENVAMMSRLITDKIDELKRFGHRKWRDVDLGAAVEGWQRYGCVTQRVSAPVNGCAFGSQGESASADCRRACDPREVKKNALRCMLCQDKADLQNDRR